MTELATILWRPRLTMERVATQSVKSARLVLAVLAINVLLALALLPMYTAAANATMVQHPELTSSSRLMIVAVSIVFSSAFNLAFCMFAALILFFSAFALGASGSYRATLEAVLIGSVPLLLSRIVRTLLFLFKVTPHVQASVFPLGVLLPALSPHGRAIADAIDPFDLWSFVLIAYGFARVSGLRRWCSWSVVAAFWTVLEIISIRMQLMGAGQ